MFGFTLSFSSFYFLIFLAFSLLIYWLTPKKYRYIPLLIESIAFLLLTDWKSIFFVLFSTLVIFFSALYIWKNNKAQKEYISQNKEKLSLDEKKAYKAKNKKKRKAVLVIGIVIVTLLLGVMKYLGFVLGSAKSLLGLFGVDFSFDLGNWFLPIGISFYTFQAISYLVDVYWGKFDSEKNVAKFALYMFYFPKFLQGPIVRYNEMQETMFSEKEFSYEQFTDGLKRMGYGYFKKMVIADCLMVFISYAFTHENITSLSGLESFLAIFFYFIQDYCDFSGYMDIAIGISNMFGIKLPENFNRPYFARGVDEYWRRWHITLGTWFKDYIFYPLSISKFSLGIGKFFKKFSKSLGQKMPAVFGLIVVWLLTGLWHGASWNYVLWGAYYGVIIILSIFFEPLFNLFYNKTHISRDNIFIKIWQHIRTIFILIVGRIIFMTSSLSDAWTIFSNSFRVWDYSIKNLVDQLGYMSWIFAILFSIIVLVKDIIQECHPESTMLERFNKKPIVYRWIMMLILVVAIIWFGWYGSGLPHFAFGYTQF